MKGKKTWRSAASPASTDTEILIREVSICHVPTNEFSTNLAGLLPHPYPARITMTVAARIPEKRLWFRTGIDDCKIIKNSI